MESNALQKAQIYENQKSTCISDEDRPVFHVTGSVGWINDPNGFSVYGGEYHLFFQYHPYSTSWGPMHWGHVKSEDLLHWQRLPIALAPDSPWDAFGCFSGSGIETPDGQHMLLYTGVRHEPSEDGTVREFQTQCIAIGDGVHYRKLSGNPVITAAQLPAGGSSVDFRDPKIWWEKAESCYYAVVGNRAADGSGSILLYRSENGLQWEFITILAASRNKWGRMWECPDFFPLDGRQVLIVNPQEMAPSEQGFHPGDNTACFIGDYDKASHHFAYGHPQPVDWGIDFYAPQTLQTPDGRRILIGWMQSWASANAKPKDALWFGQMTLPRELSIQNGRLFQTPVRELDACRCNPTVYRSVRISENQQLDGICGRVVDLTLDIRPADAQGYSFFQFTVAESSRYGTFIRYTPKTGMVSIDRSRSGLNSDIVHSREFPVADRSGCLKIRAVLDRFSLELFFNDGEQAASLTLYTPQSSDSISFEADGAVLLDVEKYSLAL